ncbi:MAG TPA: recombination protein RecR [Candidatus Fraserbacteria bacterium]|nr:recombination protein RecR [Candidatus Fraserbacteria bacterium]
MQQYPQPLERLISELKKLPGVGRVSAERFAFYLLNQETEQVRRLSQALVQVKERIHPCAQCFNYAEEQLCPVCSDPKRDRSLICVVSHPQELLKLERTHDYRGLYHVLGGLLSPINDVHPEDLRIAELLQRLKSEQVREVILALDPVVEGEATGMYLARAIKPLGIQVSQIAYGVPVGRDLAFADELTLSRALQGRVPI